MSTSAQSLSRLCQPPLKSTIKPRFCTNAFTTSSLSLPSLNSQNSFLGTLNFSFLHHPSRPPLISQPAKHARVAASLFTSPNETKLSTTGEQPPKWSWRAIKSFAMAELQARKMYIPTLGTESILMGILVEGTSLASKLLRTNGITLTKVKEECVKQLGKGYAYTIIPEHPPLTESCQKALDWVVDQKLKSGGDVTTTDLLLGMWHDAESPGHKILAALGFDDDKAKILKSLSSAPGFDEG